MNKIIFAALLTEWAGQLDRLIHELDSTLPLERRFETSLRYRRKSAFDLGGISRTPETHPQEFDEIREALPHPELDGLRAVTETMLDVAEQLRTPGSTSSPTGTRVFSGGLDEFKQVLSAMQAHQ